MSEIIGAGAVAEGCERWQVPEVSAPAPGARTLLTAAPLGAVTTLNRGQVTGWAYDAADAAAPLTVNITVNGVTTSVTADDQRPGLTPIVEPDLREVFLGDWEGGLFRKHVAEGHPAALQLFTEQRWDAIPGGEPADAFASRVGAGSLVVVPVDARGLHLCSLTRVLGDL